MLAEVTKAVIPAGGLGTRLLPASRVIPKEMFPVVDRPVIQYVVGEAVASGLTEVVLVNSRNKRSLEGYFQYSNDIPAGGSKGSSAVRELSQLLKSALIHTVYQEEPLGLGHAVLQAEPAIGQEPFAVLLADDIMEGTPPVTRQMLDVFRRFPSTIVATMRVPRERVSEYGILEVEPVTESFGGRLFRVKALVEKPATGTVASDLAVIGRYILDPLVFEILRRTPPGALGEIQLTDGIQGLINQGKPVFAFCFEGIRHDVGDPNGFLKANVRLALSSRELGPSFRSFLKSLEL